MDELLLSILLVLGIFSVAMLLFGIRLIDPAALLAAHLRRMLNVAEDTEQRMQERIGQAIREAHDALNRR